MSPCGGDWAPAGAAPRVVTTSTTAMIPRIACSCNRCVRSPCHRDVLRLQELHHAFVRAFAADARLLHAAERRGGVGDESAIEPDHAEVELLGDAHAAAQVL